MEDHFRILDLDTCPAKSRRLLQSSIDNFGWIPNQSAVMAASPELLETYQKAHDCFEASSFTEEEKTVVWLTVGLKHCNDYTIGAHRFIALNSGVKPNLVKSILAYEEIPARLQSLREFTEKVIDGAGKVSSHDIEAFRQSGFSDQQVFEVVLGFTQKVIANLVNDMARTPLDQEFEV